MKKDVTNYLVRCMEFHKLKDEHIHPIGLMCPLPIPEWKWEDFTINFITKFPKTTRQHDSIMVVVDKIIKATHFILVKWTHKVVNIAKFCMKEIARLHGVPRPIVSERDPKFTYNFWKGLFNGFGTNLNFNTIYHIDSGGKRERNNQIIENMLRMYVMDKPSKWEDYIHLVEFAYNNGYQE